MVTTMDDRAVKAVRAWADARGHRLLVGLSLGRRVAGYPLWRQLWVRASEIWPHLRYRQSRANVVPLNTADNWLHLVLGIGMIALGIVLARRSATTHAG